MLPGDNCLEAPPCLRPAVTPITNAGHRSTLSKQHNSEENVMHRREFLAASAATLARPSLTRAVSTTTLKFIPQIDLAFLDPIWNNSNVTRTHGYMVFDTLYGQDATFSASPQMVQGHVVESDGKLWTLTLRDGLVWHDGTPALARDCVASIRRWAVRDTFGGTLMAATDELTATDDRTIRFRLKKSFPLLPDALAKLTATAFMMPERLARTDPFRQITEMVGSGPYRFVTDQRIHRRRPLAAAVGACEQPRLSSEGHRGAILPIPAKTWRSSTAGTRCTAARSGSSMPSGGLAERLPSLRLNQAWRSSLPPGCSILPFARQWLSALRSSTSLAWPTLIGC